MGEYTVLLPANKAVLVLRANARRRNWYMKNDSASDIYYGKTQNVATSGAYTGILVSSGGGSVNDEFYKGNIYLISAGAVNATIVEDVEQEDVKPQDYNAFSPTDEIGKKKLERLQA